MFLQMKYAASQKIDWLWDRFNAVPALGLHLQGSPPLDKIPVDLVIVKFH